MMNRLKIGFISIMTLLVICVMVSFSYAKSLKTQDDKNKVIFFCKIVDDLDNLDKQVTRNEFAKMIIKASPYKDKSSNFVKAAVDNKYMFYYVDGDFRGENYVSYSDVARGCLALLGFINDDFKGNQVAGRTLKFISLGLNENIDKDVTGEITKQDIINAIYNTLKENKKDTSTCYGLSIFTDMTKDTDGELNADNMIDTTLSGPYYMIPNSTFNIPFDLDNTNVYLNGKPSTFEDVTYDIGCYGYVIYYLDNINKRLYAYSERIDIDSPLQLRKGKYADSKYDANNVLVPKYVTVGDYNYYLDNDDMKYQFSVDGTIKRDDYVVIIYSKIDAGATSRANDASTTMMAALKDSSKTQYEELDCDGYIIDAIQYDKIFAN